MKREEAMELATNGFEQLSEALAQGKSETLVAYLNVMARFHKYSFRNCLLIAMQRPAATHVAGYRKWEQLGRHVKKGEKGIAILAPMVYKQNAEEQAGNESSEAASSTDPKKVLRGFRAVHVYDVEQTDGKPLPEFAAVHRVCRAAEAHICVVSPTVKGACHSLPPNFRPPQLATSPMTGANFSCLLV